MKITEVTSKTFFYSTKTVSDDEGHTHPDPDLKEHKVKTTLFSIHTDEGISGYSFGVGKEITEQNGRILFNLNVRSGDVAYFFII